MPLHNDNELDRLSREAADQFDAELPASGWDALERRLDEELPQERRKRRLLLWWWLPGLLLLGGALWGVMKWNEPVKTNAEKIPVITETNKRNPIINTDSKSESTPQEAAAATETTKSEGDQRPHSSGRTSVDNGQIINNSHLSVVASVKRKPVSQRSKTTQTPESQAAQGLQQTNNNADNPTKTAVDPYITSTQDKQLPGTVTHDSPEQKSRISDSPAILVNRSTPKASITDPSAATVLDSTRITANKKPLTPSSSRRNTFYATVLAGADFSNVKFSSAGRTGFNAGILAGYYITDKLSINSGIVYNAKNYKARGKDFTPKGAMVYYDIDKIEGGCNMLDIPLNVRYDLGIKTRSRFFISAGVSSYLMKKEDYEYYYYYNGNPGSRNWSTNENSNYLFSILNFSGGMEQQLGSRLHFMAEPYLKLPLKGVGTGNIQLNSFGINLGLKYQFGKKGK
ncbi:MAG: outer membrane beta-barrel protein [Pseudobacter sp.]|uniref:outer membrane beta-barrel protein n=1 Tax=Pseudobacter sp. TaxID=2045420 RepID=UPI003F81DDBB